MAKNTGLKVAVVLLVVAVLGLAYTGGYFGQAGSVANTNTNPNVENPAPGCNLASAPRHI